MNPKKNSQLLITLIIVASVMGWAIKYSPVCRTWQQLRSLWQTKKPAIAPSTPRTPETWMTVFVHGTFGSVMSLLSAKKVLADDLKDSRYRIVNKKMRKDPYFFKDQFILDRGLVSIPKTLDTDLTTSDRFAAFPLSKAYATIADYTTKGQEKNLFYAFGWSGLMSQQRRRSEAIRLYNSLIEEQERLRTEGINAKIRIIAHSHGGNLALNLGGIGKILATQSYDPQQKFSPIDQEHESLQEMFSLINQLITKENAIQKKGQKSLDYIPTHKTLLIDELILLGTPIQPETEYFALSHIFKKIYNFYSSEDIVQQIDWFTTKQYYSNQRFHESIIHKGRKKITQIKIMCDHQQVPSEKNTSYARSWFNAINALLSRQSKDPTHKELWFINWKPANSETNTFFISPLPAVVLMPIILNVLATKPTLADVDINLSKKNNLLEVVLHRHQQNFAESSRYIPMSLIDEIKKEFKKWEPPDLSEPTGFDAIYRHLS
ncbi:hypothetical protein IPF37_03705 [bacterium]|nr:MAG: hypothetical protein IPF37_03705 [bacterium]